MFLFQMQNFGVFPAQIRDPGLWCNAMLGTLGAWLVRDLVVEMPFKMTTSQAGIALPE
jgi:hypothetical protein